MTTEMEFLSLFRHDLHKVRSPGAPSHLDALIDKTARQADGLAAWMSRGSGFLEDKFKQNTYRRSLIFQSRNLKNPRTLVNQHRYEVAELFKELDPIKLHGSVLRSKLLNLYCEARSFPYTSLKYHLLLVCALYYNLKLGFELKDLYLCENVPPDSPFQVIYQDSERKWSILPNRSNAGLSKVYPPFYLTWERRRKESFGGDHQIFDENLSSIGSWSIALAAIEDYFTLIRG